MNIFKNIFKFCIVASIAVLVVGCEASEHWNPGIDQPVRPIKRRPITPDGTILRPRIISPNFEIDIPHHDVKAGAAAVQIYASTGELLFDNVLYSNEELEIGEDPSTLIIVVDGQEVDLNALE